MIRTSIIIAVVALVLGGCATPPPSPVSIDGNVLGPKAGRVGVAMTALPKIEVQMPGTGCLLCMIAASAANSSLSAHAETLPYEDLPKLKEMLAERLRKKGMAVSVIDEEIKLDALDDIESDKPNVARKNFSPLQKKYNIDRLVVIHIKSLGFIRTYSSYFPTSDPKSVMDGAGYMVNLSNNTYEWYAPVKILRSADKSWDEPPKFPGLTNAYFQALEMGKDELLGPFSK